MHDVLVSARIPKRLKDKMGQAIEKGLYINMSDLVRSAVREKLKEEGEVT